MQRLTRKVSSDNRKKTAGTPTLQCIGACKHRKTHPPGVLAHLTRPEMPVLLPALSFMVSLCRPFNCSLWPPCKQNTAGREFLAILGHILLWSQECLVRNTSISKIVKFPPECWKRFVLDNLTDNIFIKVQRIKKQFALTPRVLRQDKLLHRSLHRFVIRQFTFFKLQ